MEDDGDALLAERVRLFCGAELKNEVGT